MTTMLSLPEDLMRDILSRVPLTSLRALRCTCRTWKALSKTHVFGKKAARNQFLGFTVINDKACSLILDLQGIHNEGDMVHKSTKKISKLDRTIIYEVFHSDGLLLCVDDEANIVVWNPYLGQNRCIPPASCDFGDCDTFAFGYDKNNHNHKILRFCYESHHPNFCFLELFDFKTSSWRVLDIKRDFNVDDWKFGVSLKGNTYFVGQHNTAEVVDVLLCFDFTTERFRPPLPFQKYAGQHVVLSCVKEEKLAVLYQYKKTMEIWISTKIEHDDVTWSMFLKVEMTPLNGFPDDFNHDIETLTESFFIDEEKKIAVVVFDDKLTRKETCYSLTAHIIGQDGYLKSLSIAECPNHGTKESFVFVECPNQV